VECALSERKMIARSCKLSRPTVPTKSNVRRCRLGWPLPKVIDDAALDRLLFPPSITADRRSRALPEWTAIHQELKRKGGNVISSVGGIQGAASQWLPGMAISV